MYIETVGYIVTKRDYVDEIKQIIKNNDLYVHDDIPYEITCDVDEDLLKNLVKEGTITQEESDQLLKECNVIKFHY